MIDATEKELLWNSIQIAYAYEEELGLDLQGNISIVILEAKGISPDFVGETLVVTVAAAIGYNRRIYKNTSPALVVGNREKLVWNESFNFPVHIRKRKGHPGNMISVFLMRKNLLDNTQEITGKLDLHLHDLIHAVSEATWHPIYHNSHYMMDLCIMHCFAYGLFGYGISHQLKLEDEATTKMRPTNTKNIYTKTIKKYLEKTMYPQLPIPLKKMDSNLRTIVPSAMSHPKDYIPFIQICEYNLGAMSKFTYVARPKERPHLKEYMLRIPRLVEYLKRCSHGKDRLAFIHQIVQDSYVEEERNENSGYDWTHVAEALQEGENSDEKEDMDIIFDDLREQKISKILRKHFHPIKKNKESRRRIIMSVDLMNSSQRRILDDMSDSTGSLKIKVNVEKNGWTSSLLVGLQRFADYCYMTAAKCLHLDLKKNTKQVKRSNRDQENDIVRMVTTHTGSRLGSSSDEGNGLT